jgi:uncharacterized 2Fe-2S/4Fe-4S cluster protein (DUF4445 family)
MSGPPTAQVIWQPSGRRGEVELGLSLMEASRRLGVDLEALCGEKKVCGKCKVRIEEGWFEKYGLQSRPANAGPWTVEEKKFITPAEREAGFRLACAAQVDGDLLVFVPEESRAGKQVVSKAAREIAIDWDPAVRLYTVGVARPTIDDPTGDFERVCLALEEKHGLTDLTVDLPALRTLPGALREGDWQITVAVWQGREVIRFWPGEQNNYYGLAVDLGTTTIAAYLCHLGTMEVMDTVSMMNPQVRYGEDVMARITFAMQHEDGLARMSADVIAALNELIDRACQNTHPPSQEEKDAQGRPVMVESPEKGRTYPRLAPHDLMDLTLGGNTAMHHLLLGLDPQYVGLSPFPPVIHRSLDVKARDLGLNLNPGAYVYVLPNEAGFVGADNVAVLLAEKPYQNEKIQLIIDIGTNGELVLGNRDKLISSSCATGPALEGAQLSHGMRAAPGAIERIRIDPATHEVDYKVIGREAWRGFSKPDEMKTKGICGSGILDLLAELFRAGVIDKSGRFARDQKSSRFRTNPDEPRQKEFVIAWAEETSIGKDVVVTQKDIRQIQLAKGALYTGCKLMMRRLGVTEVDKIKIAGAFGTHVDPAKALIMGLFPDCDLDDVIAVGNAAGDGARVALLDKNARRDADWIARRVEYIELTVEEDFERQFMEAMQIPHMTDDFPHLKDLLQS